MLRENWNNLISKSKGCLSLHLPEWIVDCLFIFSRFVCRDKQWLHPALSHKTVFLVSWVRQRKRLNFHWCRERSHNVARNCELSANGLCGSCRHPRLHSEMTADVEQSQIYLVLLTDGFHIFEIRRIAWMINCRTVFMIKSNPAGFPP